MYLVDLNDFSMDLKLNISPFGRNKKHLNWWNWWQSTAKLNSCIWFFFRMFTNFILAQKIMFSCSEAAHSDICCLLFYKLQRVVSMMLSRFRTLAISTICSMSYFRNNKLICSKKFVPKFCVILGGYGRKRLAFLCHQLASLNHF